MQKSRKQTSAAKIMDRAGFFRDAGQPGRSCDSKMGSGEAFPFLQLPDVVLRHILAMVSYDQLSKIRLVSRR